MCSQVLPSVHRIYWVNDHDEFCKLVILFSCVLTFCFLFVVVIVPKVCRTELTVLTVFIPFARYLALFWIHGLVQEINGARVVAEKNWAFESTNSRSFYYTDKRTNKLKQLYSDWTTENFYVGCRNETLIIKFSKVSYVDKFRKNNIFKLSEDSIKRWLTNFTGSSDVFVPFFFFFFGYSMIRMRSNRKLF